MVAKFVKIAVTSSFLMIVPSGALVRNVSRLIFPKESELFDCKHRQYL